MLSGKRQSLLSLKFCLDLPLEVGRPFCCHLCHSIVYDLALVLNTVIPSCLHPFYFFVLGSCFGFPFSLHGLHLDTDLRHICDPGLFFYSINVLALRAVESNISLMFAVIVSTSLSTKFSVTSLPPPLAWKIFTTFVSCSFSKSKCNHGCLSSVSSSVSTLASLRQSHVCCLCQRLDTSLF